MDQERRYQVFISYDDGDEKVAERIATILRDRYRIEPWLRSWSAVPGREKQAEMEDGLRKSDVFAMLIGQDGVQGLERLALRTAIEARVDNMGGDFRVIPVYLPGCPVEEVKKTLPDMFRIFTSVIFSEPDDPVAMEKLVAGIEGREPIPINVVEVPFVIFAMTRKEAEELVSGALFADERVKYEQPAFNDLTLTLERCGLTDIASHYDSERDLWRPPITQPATMREVVEKLVDWVNERREEETPHEPKIVARFLSNKYLSDNEEERLWTHDRLKHTGFILIVDAISMYHALLRDDKLQPDEVSSFDLASIVIISPPVSEKLLSNVILPEWEIGRKMMKQAYRRYDNKLDIRCEFGIGNNRLLRRWLASVVPQAASIVKHEKPNPGQKQLTRDQFKKDDITPTGERPWRTRGRRT